VAALICAPAPPALTRRITIYGWSTRRGDRRLTPVFQRIRPLGYLREGDLIRSYPFHCRIATTAATIVAIPTRNAPIFRARVQNGESTSLPVAGAM
jgi:hypothetical protein